MTIFLQEPLLVKIYNRTFDIQNQCQVELIIKVNNYQHVVIIFKRGLVA